LFRVAASIGGLAMHRAVRLPTHGKKMLS
jgi:hypothetical protein